MNTSITVNGSHDTFRAASGLNLIAAIWLIISPFVLTFSQVPSALWNNVIVGIAAAIIAIVRLNATDQTGWSWANVLLGVWTIISPWALGFSVNGAENLGFNSALVWNNVVTGAVIAFLAVMSMMGGHALPTTTTTHA